MFNSGTALLEAAARAGGSIAAAALCEEVAQSDSTEEAVLTRLGTMLDIMRASAHKALEEPQKTMGGMIDGQAQQMYAYARRDDTLCQSGALAMAMALSGAEVNASMGRICAAPTAGACGILPAALFSQAARFGWDDSTLCRGLLTAAAVGAIIARNATVAGAEGGCQAECGSAASMAAAALTELRGGTPEMCLQAAGMALKNIMGLVCDPIAGLVEEPCATRNASGVMNALCSADMALAGIRSVVPFDEVVEAVRHVGRQLPPGLRETAGGGLATTKTGKKYKKLMQKTP